MQDLSTKRVLARCSHSINAAIKNANMHYLTNGLRQHLQWMTGWASMREIWRVSIQMPSSALSEAYQINMHPHMRVTLIYLRHTYAPNDRRLPVAVNNAIVYCIVSFIACYSMYLDIYFALLQNKLWTGRRWVRPIACRDRSDQVTANRHLVQHT